MVGRGCEGNLNVEGKEYGEERGLPREKGMRGDS